MLLLLSEGLNAQNNNGNEIKIDINYPIKKDSTIDITSKISADILGFIINNTQPDFKDKNTIIISIKRDTVKRTITLHLKKEIFNKLDEKQKKILHNGINLVAGKKDSIMLKINTQEIRYDNDTIEEGQMSTAELDEQSASVSSPSTSEVDKKIKRVEDIIKSFEKEMAIIQYEVYAIGGLILLLILVLLFRHKSPNVEENEDRKKELEDLQSKTQSLSVDIMQLKNNKASSDEVKLITNKINTIGFELENIKTRIEAIQNSNRDTEQRSSRERGYMQRTEANVPVNKRIGYTTEPTINGLEEKKILSDSSDFCIYEIEFIDEQKALYYINRDPKALQNILSVAYMIPGENNNQTNNQQATQVKTEEHGVLQKLNGKWYTEKTLKFTIL